MNKLIIYIALMFIPFCSFSQNWQSLGLNLNSDIKVLYADTVDNLLYLGGNFHLNYGVGDDTLRGVAAWDGVTFLRLGKGIDYFNITSIAGPVYSIIRFQNEIYVGGGVITMAGDYWVNGIAKWNGAAWDTIAGGVKTSWGNIGMINDMKVINNELYVAGGFDFAGINNIPVNSLAKFDGTQWSNVHNFPQWDYHTNNKNIVDAIAEYNGVLYVGGRFSDAAPADTMFNICRWNGNNWEQLGNGIGGSFSSIEKMVEYKGKLYVAGSFDKLGNPNNPGNRIAAWNGINWEQVGDFWGITPSSFAYIKDMVVYNNELYVVGMFNKVGSINTTHIAKYDGTNWCTLGDNFDYKLGAAAVYNNELYVGGSFTMINNDTINQLAKWIGGNYVDSCEVFVSVEDHIYSEEEITIYPNPSNGNITIDAKGFKLTTIEIYNLSGQLIFQKPLVQNATTVNLTKHSRGMYFVKLKSKDKTTVRKIVYQ